MLEGETHIRAGIAGAVEYLAPEYIKYARFNEKIDVYSFGVVLLVLLTAQRPTESFSAAEDCGLVEGVEKCMENGRFEEIFDPIIVAEETWPNKKQQLKAFLALAFHCTLEDPEERPEITDEMLSKCAVMTLEEESSVSTPGDLLSGLLASSTKIH